MIKAIIFDMDGVISDTQKLHSRVESELLGRFGIDISPEEITKKYAGTKTRDFINELLKHQNKEYDLDKLIAEKWRKMAELSNLIEEVPGVISLIKRLYHDNYVLAVASASDADYVNPVLNKLNVSKYFETIITGDMVKNGKPDPAIFLLAASKININPKECLVIEDGINGMEAAKNANMKCIGLVKNKNDKYPTPNLVTSLAEVTVEYIKNL